MDSGLVPPTAPTRAAAVTALPRPRSHCQAGTAEAASRVPCEGPFPGLWNSSRSASRKGRRLSCSPGPPARGRRDPEGRLQGARQAPARQETPACRWRVHATAGFFLSHPWEGARSPPRHHRPGPGSPLRAPEGHRTVPASLPPPRRRSGGSRGPAPPLRASPLAPSGRPAAAAARSTEPPARPSSCQRLTQQVAGSGNSQHFPEAEILPARGLEADRVPPPPLLPPGGFQDALRGERAGSRRGLGLPS